MKKHLYFVFWYLALVYWYLRRPQSHGAGVIVEDVNKILLVRTTYGHRNLWGLPGGHKKRSEDYKTTAARELSEELGLTIPLKQLGIIKLTEDFRHDTDAVFLGKYGGQTIKLQKSEIKEYRWWPKKRLPKNVFASTKEALRLYLDD